MTVESSNFTKQVWVGKEVGIRLGEDLTKILGVQCWNNNNLNMQFDKIFIKVLESI